MILRSSLSWWAALLLVAPSVFESVQAGSEVHSPHATPETNGHFDALMKQDNRTSTMNRMLQFNQGDCTICDQDNKVRPSSLTMQYIGGVGQISRFQDEDKATCRSQNFATSESVSAYGLTYQVTSGSIITIFASDNDGELDAETDFVFASSGVNCFIHTSCSQPLVAGDQIGPWIILQGNQCSFGDVPAVPNTGNVNNNADCAICDQDNKVRPDELTMQYIGGTGSISRFQDEDKATCRNQNFAESDTVSAYGLSYQVTSGSIITLFASDNGGRLDAETDFIFSNSGVNCFIHTSCSQPLVAGDQIGPFLILAGNNCVFSFCGDGILDSTTEVCDEGPNNGLSGSCRADCSIPDCGDGIMDAGEECDDGNTDEMDGCTNICTTSTCGDGITDPDLGETCDDGNTIDTDSCRNDCTSCGDGVMDAGESCDLGENNGVGACRVDCTIPRCGDGIMDVALGERCDDGNAFNTDSCRNDCTRCGDGFMDVSAGEQCDFGDNDNAAGVLCRPDCSVPTCGDGVMDPGEECDDGNTNNLDSCRNNCVLPTCGDLIVDPGEQCDDGAFMNDNDGCRNDCTLPSCGDGRVDPINNEQCDDGNAIDTDGCRNDCTSPTCGDGVTDVGEACDEGAGMPSSTCRIDCSVPSCGDGIMDADEECDDGNSVNEDSCRNNCVLPSCGDGIQDAGEQCDLGVNGNDLDGCRDDCTLPFCGDGIVDVSLGEACDDGRNGDDSDGCRDDCTDCICQATPTYNEVTGAVTIDFDMCGEEPLQSDFIGIYPCDVDTLTATQEWYDSTICNQWPAACGDVFALGYEEGQVYVNELYIWASFTCGDPQEIGCQHSSNRDTVVWPSQGTVTIDPNIEGARWAFLGGRPLAPGCYKVLMNRDTDFISPPPYPTICGAWEDALTFTVPDRSTSTQATPLEFSPGETASVRQSGSPALSAFVSFVVVVFALCLI